MTNSGALRKEEPTADISRSVLEPAELEVLALYGTPRVFDKGTIVISEGDETTTFFAIKEGTVEVYRADENGREVIVNTLSDGEYFGELVIISPGRRSASVRAARRTACLAVTKSDFEQCLTDHPALLLKVSKHFATRVRELTDQVSDLALVAVYGRLVRMLNRLAKPERGAAVIAKRPTHDTLARHIGCCREMVTRIVRDLETGGYLQKAGPGWEIPRPLPKNW